MHSWGDNNERVHLGKYCYGKILVQTFSDAKRLAFDTNDEAFYTLKIYLIHKIHRTN